LQESGLNKKVTDLDKLEAKRAVIVGRQLYFCFNLMLDRTMTKLERRGHANIGMAQSVLLRNLDFSGTQITLIAKRAGVTKQAIIKVARSLQNRGYLKIVPDPVDRRAKLVKLTRKGYRFVNDVIEISEEVENELAAAVGRKKMDELQVTLQAILQTDLPPA
jgi:DNA-binding MarR family transcriptional regulator